MIHHAQIDIDIRADPAEAVQDLRHPEHGNAGVSRDADRFCLLLCDALDLVFQICICLQKLADHRHQFPSFLCQGDSIVAPDDERKPDFPLQAVHQMGKPRLGVSDHLRCPGKAA